MPIIMAEVNAIKELNAKIEAQQAQIDNLTARVARLEKTAKI
jgi:cell division protein FtsL